VLEGSTLGGRVLYKHINKALGFEADSGAAYFCGYGADTAGKWRLFLSCLSDYAADQVAAERIIASAIRTFTQMDLWLSGTHLKQGDGH
jgi:heme oxygenase